MTSSSSLKRQRPRRAATAASLLTMAASTAITTVTATQSSSFTDDTIHQAVHQWLKNSEGRSNGPIISQWNVSLVTNMDYLFAFAPELTNEDLSAWDVSSVTSMQSMFQGSRFYTGKGDGNAVWDTSRVQSMEAMFYEATSFQGQDGLGLSQWDTSNVRTMKAMFQEAQAMEADLSDWNVGEVTDLSYFLSGATSFTNLEGINKRWNVERVTSMDGMLSGTPQLQGETVCFQQPSALKTAREMLCCSGAQFQGQGCGTQTWVRNQANACTYSCDNNKNNSNNSNHSFQENLFIALLSVTMMISFVVVIWKYVPTTYLRERCMVGIRHCCSRCCGLAAKYEYGLEESPTTAEPTGTMMTEEEVANNIHVQSVESHC